MISRKKKGRGGEGRGGETLGWEEMREKERDKFSSLRTPPYELILTGTLLLSPSPSLCSKRMFPEKEKRKLFTI